MKGYKVINIESLLEYDETGTKKLLQEFTCKNNADVEYFIRHKAIEFSRCGFAKTHLVFASYKENPVIAGYFSLSGAKSFVVGTKAVTKRVQRRLARFGTYNESLKQFYIPAPLIGQLGKNSTYPSLISGAELLYLACDKIKSIQYDIGGKFAYLECEDIPFLREFYQQNGFVCFGERILDNDEQEHIKTTKLLQLLKYL